MLSPSRLTSTFWPSRVKARPLGPAWHCQVHLAVGDEPAVLDREDRKRCLRRDYR